MNKIKILHLTTDSKIGGTEKNIIALVTHLDKNRYESIVVALRPGGDLIEEIKKQGIRGEILGIRNFLGLSKLIRLWKLIKSERIDILHTYLWHANIIGRLVGYFSRVPIIISSERCLDLGRSKYKIWLNSLTARICRVIICVSEQVKELLVEREKIPADKMVVIRSGIDMGRFCAVDGTEKEERAMFQSNRDENKYAGKEEKGDTERGIDIEEKESAERGKKSQDIEKNKEIKEGERKRQEKGDSGKSLRKQLRFESGTKVIGTVGRLRPEKGHRYLIEAAKSLVARDRQIRFLIVGDGPEEASLKALAEKLGVDKKIVFAGYRDDIPEILSIMDVFVLPSLEEGLPMAVIEAMAAGVPVVATDIGGTRELVENGQTGWLVEPASSNSLVIGIEAVLNDNHRARHIATNAQDMVKRRFTLERMLQQIDNTYQRLLGYCQN